MKEGTRNKKQGGKMMNMYLKKSEKAFTFSLFIRYSIFVITIS